MQTVASRWLQAGLLFAALLAGLAPASPRWTRVEQTLDDTIPQTKLVALIPELKGVLQVESPDLLILLRDRGHKLEPVWRAPASMKPPSSITSTNYNLNSP